MTTDPFTSGGIIPKRKRGGDSQSALPAATIQAAFEHLTGAEPGATLVANEPAPTRGIAGSTAYQLREALADRQVYTKTSTWPVEDPPKLVPGTKRVDVNQPFYWGLTVVRREDFRDATGKRAETS